MAEGEQTPSEQAEQPEQAGQMEQPANPERLGSAVKPSEQPASAVTPRGPTRRSFDPARFAGVSYEETRKGRPPVLIKNPDQATWNDSETSQYSLVNMTSDRWKPIRPIFIPE